ncbi:hypothetical protein N7509_010755 [Penicillium cosmopolitanum]|uniref:A-kinase anchor protein 7-like phosphoesterase domain-containing protein n=1 Tax=Penicillium cosmopolitanum TaxID=1131564 RepID=A0A9W9VS54_9EURO|nr:uncharacterized protein N7509_010755 [Penicillium cosmopolitanum]KAJ5388214.1 hypothetical protein N7509_010755 [Penicillium cosmopolitanum]
MAEAKRNASGSKPQPRNQRPEKKPPLTHFLCLPLVNEASLPQLETSVATFKAAYPPVPVAELPHSPGPAVHQDISRPLIPHGALRPLGTLHLTLGVMSLAKKDRLGEALSFFHSLDLRALMCEAERVAGDLRATQLSSKDLRGIDTPPESCHAPLNHSNEFMISLESLHALPRAKTATVLHASPVDPTGRLYPFCIMLRDKFIEAGFIVGEGEKKSDMKSITPNKDAQPSSTCPDLAAEDNVSPKQEEHREGHLTVTREPKLDPYETALARKPKPRPLLLHATLVNTIYVRGRPKARRGNGPKHKGGPKRIEFDARHLLARYRDYYIDEARTIPRNFSDLIHHDENARDSAGQIPFIWADKIPIDSICICEMGAKKLDLDNAAMADPASALWTARLGEKYTVVAQRNIGSTGASSRPISQGSVDGGVRLR